MKIALIFLLATMVTDARIGGLKQLLVGKITKEKAISNINVRLVRKNWHPKGVNLGTDEPLAGYPGNYSQLFGMIRKFRGRYEYIQQPMINATKLFDDPNYNSSMPSVIITHPMAIGNSFFVSHVVGVLALRNLHKHYNVFAMQAPWLGWQFQMSCARVALGRDPWFKPVAEAFASYLLDGISQGKLKPYQLSFIGFSYSATLNAYIARVVRDRTGQLTHTLMTLDAFQFAKNKNQYHTPISKNDAMFVHMIHTSSKVGGTLERIGTVDIVINNGWIQPGCEAGSGCSHRRVVPVFLFSVLAQGVVVARRCDTWEDFSDCKCSDPNSDLLIVSFPVNEEARGLFFLRTGDDMPFVYGLKGAYCEAEAE